VCVFTHLHYSITSYLKLHFIEVRGDTHLSVGCVSPLSFIDFSLTLFRSHDGLLFPLRCVSTRTYIIQSLHTLNCISSRCVETRT